MIFLIVEFIETFQNLLVSFPHSDLVSSAQNFISSDFVACLFLSGALNPDRLAILIERYQELESFGFSEKEKFLYGSHYSSPGLILHFLIRQEPFTSMAIDLQSGKFDCPDRLFFDLNESWKSCNTSSSDVKELIPGNYPATASLLISSKTSRGIILQ